MTSVSTSAVLLAEFGSLLALAPIAVLSSTSVPGAALARTSTLIVTVISPPTATSPNVQSIVPPVGVQVPAATGLTEIREASIEAISM